MLQVTQTTMSRSAGEFALHIEQVEGFEFRTRFDKEQFAELRTDEPAPLGQDRAPNPARILAAAIGNCLAASLLFCLSRQGATPTALGADVNVSLVRNENNRLRVGAVKVTLHPRFASAVEFQRCLEVFEDFCVVTQSVREGIAVDVEVAEIPSLSRPVARETA